MTCRTALCRRHDLKDSTIRTILRRLEEKGYVEHDVEGRTYVYRPRVEPQNIAPSKSAASSTASVAARSRICSSAWSMTT